MRSILSHCVLFVLWLQSAATAQTFDPAAKAAAIAPYLDEQTLAVGRVDLNRIDSAALVKTLGQVGPQNDPQFGRQLGQIETALKAVLAALRGAGMSEIYAVFSLADVPQGPPFLVAPLKAGSDAQMAAGVLREVTRLPAAQPIGNVIIAGTEDTINRLKTIRAAARPEFARAFQAAGDATVQIVYSPTEDSRRVFKEMLPRLPDEIGGGSSKALADGLWAALGINVPPELALKLTIQSKDAESAAALRALAVNALALAREGGQAKRIPQLDNVIRILTPRLMGDQLVISANHQDGTALTLLNALVPAVQDVRTAAGRGQSVNNLKQFGLALHSYHDVYARFPPQAIRSKDGKPLLSWRVAVLPFLDASALYKEFHLDEPWDSEHNRKLIEKMPAALASPSLGDELRAKGMTSYVVPLSRQTAMAASPPQSARPGGPNVPGAPEMVFDDPAGRPFNKITDGTSNTILLLETHPSAAVIWTKPDDLVIDENDSFRHVRGQPNEGFNAVLCDGSVKFIKTTIDLKTFWNLLHANDGNPIGDF